jgi:hypothetical protein
MSINRLFSLRITAASVAFHSNGLLQLSSATHPSGKLLQTLRFRSIAALGTGLQTVSAVAMFINVP